MVRKATLNKLGKFTKQDIRELCPVLSISSIEGALRKLVKAGELKREGFGMNMLGNAWVRILLRFARQRERN